MELGTLRWEPPGPGPWFLSKAHMPVPMCGLMAELLPLAGRGWRLGTDRYGLPANSGAFEVVNCWGFYSPGVPPAADLEAMERTALEALEGPRWRVELRRWQEEVRPTVVDRGRSLLREAPAELSVDALTAHLDAAIDHFVTWAPEHFARTLDGELAVGALLHAAAGWGLDPNAVLDALTGTATATSSAERLIERIAAGLRAAGVVDPVDLDEMRAAGADVGAALDELLVDYGWRAFGVDLTEPTLAERPQGLVTAVHAALAGFGGRRRPAGSALDALRVEVPDRERGRFDVLAADAGVGYGHNDDNSVLLFSLPLGIIRRAVLEVGRRLHGVGALQAPEHAFEARQDELRALLAGEGPPAAGLAERAALRAAVASIDPPPMLGEPLPPGPAVDLPASVRRLEDLLTAFRSVVSPQDGGGVRAAATVGSEIVRGRAVVARDAADALDRLAPGDVLVTVTTSAPYNTVFPIVAAVAVQEGSLMSHAAVLARELGVTAVIGVPDLLSRVADGDLVEIDPGSGTIRVVEA